MTIGRRRTRGGRGTTSQVRTPRSGRREPGDLRRADCGLAHRPRRRGQHAPRQLQVRGAASTLPSRVPGFIFHQRTADNAQPVLRRRLCETTTRATSTCSATVLALLDVAPGSNNVVTMIPRATRPSSSSSRRPTATSSTGSAGRMRTRATSRIRRPSPCPRPPQGVIGRHQRCSTTRASPCTTSMRPLRGSP